MPPNQQTEFIIRARDEASAVIAKIAKQYDVSMKDIRDSVKAASEAEGGAAGSVDKHSLASKRLMGVIKEERQEMRARNFAFRESAAAVDQLSTVFVGPNGLGNSIKKGLGSFYEFDFALKAVGATVGGMGGKLGMLGGFLGTIAMPVSVAVGAVAILSERFDELDKKLAANLEQLGKLNSQLRNTEGIDAQAAAVRRYLEAATRELDVTTFTLIANALNSQMGTMFAIEDAAIAVTGALVDQMQAQKDILEGEKKRAEESLKAVKASQSVNSLYLQTRTILLDIAEQEHGRTNTLQGRLAVANEELANLRFFKTELQAQHAPYSDILQMEINILNKTKERSAILDEIKDKILNMPVPMKPREANDNTAYIDDEQKKRFEGNEKLVKFMEQGETTRHALVMENQAAWMTKATNNIKMVAQTQIIETSAAQMRISSMQDAMFTSLQAGFTAIGEGISIDIGGAFEDVFGEAHSLLEKFTQAVLVSLGRIAAEALAKKVIGGIASLIPGFGAIASFLGFHEGGAVARAHAGAYIDAPPSREFPIIVRGGETIRTEKQEQEAQARMNGGGGASYVFNFYAPVAEPDWVVQSIKRALHQTNTTVDKLLVSNRNNLKLAGA